MVSFAFAQTAIVPTGSGTEGDPYVVSSLGNLYWMTQDTSRWDDNYIQTTDINASETATWDDGDGGDPEGWPLLHHMEGMMPPFVVYGFSGSYDGQGHVIQNLYYDREHQPDGFFAYAINATISNLGLENIELHGAWYSGALVGRCNNSTITKCYSTGIVSGSGATGGLVGYAEGSENDISYSYSTCTVTSTSNGSGGFVGKNTDNSLIENCYSLGSISSVSSEVGGFIGVNQNAGAIVQNCYSTGHASGTSSVGGFVGTNSGSVNQSFWDLEVSGNASSVAATGKTTAQMKTESTFTSAGWNFTTIWDMDAGTNDGYAFLLNMPSETALPITLSSFNVEALNGKVELRWSTATETENAYFLIYRDGEVIGRIAGAGTTTEPQDYRFVDDRVIPGMHEYAISDLTYGGVEEMHKRVEVEVKAETEHEVNFVLNKAYPNPFNPSVSINFQLSTFNKVRASIYNTNGEFVSNLLNKEMSAGTHDLTWNASGMPSGVYIVKMLAGDVMQSQKIVLMK